MDRPHRIESRPYARTLAPTAVFAVLVIAFASLGLALHHHDAGADAEDHCALCTAAQHTPGLPTSQADRLPAPASARVELARPDLEPFARDLPGDQTSRAPPGPFSVA